MQKTDATYRERVFELAEEDYRPPRIARIIRDEAIKKGREDYPSERTVRRLYDEHQKKDPAIKRESALFRWPQSMRRGTLPWEASAAGLDLLWVRDVMGRGRPSNRLVRWYWILTSALPRMDRMSRGEYAALLATWDKSQEIADNAGVSIEGVDYLLAYMHQHDVAYWESYQEALTRVDNPLPRFEPSFKGLAEAQEYFWHILGTDAMAGDLKRYFATVGESSDPKDSSEEETDNG